MAVTHDEAPRQDCNGDKEAYQIAGPNTQAHALLGAAQAYLLEQSPRRVFPFLWQDRQFDPGWRFGFFGPPLASSVGQVRRTRLPTIDVRHF